MLSGSTSSAIFQLEQVLVEEVTVCQSLLETVYEERKAIHSLAVMEFHAINCRRLAILEMLQRLTEKRDGLVSQLSRTYQLPESASTLQRIIEAIEAIKDSDAETLRKQYDRFMTTARTVRDQVKQNVVLIENIRGFLDKALCAGVAGVPGLELYTNTGHNRITHAEATMIRQQG
jgi:flagellar biosynthesis/type III secretory pathway chaperone